MPAARALLAAAAALALAGTPHAQPAGPGTRAGHVLAFDARRGHTLLLGGDAAGEPLLAEPLWGWTGTAWRAVAPEGGEAPRHRTLRATAWDARRGVLVVYGGIGPASGTRFGDTWEWDGARWTEIR